MRDYRNHMQVVLPETTALIANPFVVGRPLTGASSSLYVGREDIFDWFAENLVGGGQPNALLLYGRRRIGKTSTLYQLVEGARGLPLRENRSRRLYPAYVDLQRFAGRPTDEWLRRLARDICQRVNTSNLERSIPDSPVAGETAYAAFDRCLDRLEQTLPDDSLILLAIDEFEQIRAGIESGTLDPEVLPYLRSQVQHRDRIVFLLCGSAALLEPFWAPLADLTARREVEGLDFEQTRVLIRRPLEGILEVDNAAAEAIWRKTNGHPFLIQSICHRLVSLANRRHSRDVIRQGDIEPVVQHLEDEGYSGDVGFTRDMLPPAMTETRGL